MDQVTGAVIIAGITTVGKPTAEALAAVVGRIITPSADAVGQGIAASLQVWAEKRKQLTTECWPQSDAFGSLLVCLD